jgi:hypothetical protein
MNDVAKLYQLIMQWRLHWRYPQELNRIVKKIERGRMRPQQAKRWLRKIRPWVEQQQRCFNPFGPAPDQETLGEFMVEFGELIERPGTRAGIRSNPRHLLVAGVTGSGKSNLLRRIIDGLDAHNRSTYRLHRDSGPGL